MVPQLAWAGEVVSQWSGSGLGGTTVWRGARSGSSPSPRSLLSSATRSSFFACGLLQPVIFLRPQLARDKVSTEVVWRATTEVVWRPTTGAHPPTGVLDIW